MDYSYLFRRRHPEYRCNHLMWERCRNAYSGGADYIRKALIQHVSEVDLEFAERLNRAYYFNYPRKIARLITQYILAVEPSRINADALLLEDFSRNGLRVNEVMRQFSTLLNVYGSAWMLVEMPAFTGEVTPERQLQENLHPYAVVYQECFLRKWELLPWAL